MLTKKRNFPDARHRQITKISESKTEVKAEMFAVTETLARGLKR